MNQQAMINTRPAPAPAALPAVVLAFVATLCMATATPGARASPAGFTIGVPQEQTIRPGMSQATVHKQLGRPSRTFKYPGKPNDTWAYEVVGKEQTVFEIEFDAKGKVLNAGEWVYPHTVESDPPR